MYYSYGYDLSYVIEYLFVIIAFVITLGSQILVNSSYSKYKKCDNGKNVTGFDTARKILDENGLNDIDIVEVRGNLTDHYDPTRKVVRLSHDIYSGTSVASVAVAAHECGHAIQDKEGYLFLRIRSFIYPIVNLGTRLAYIILLLGLILEYMDLIMVGIVLVGLGLVFQIITLPVEINASKRAAKEIDQANLGNKKDQAGVKEMLTSAALTYLAGVLSSALYVLRLLLIFTDRRD